MPEHLHRAVIVVELDIEEAFGVGGPDNAAVGLLDEVAMILAAIPFAHADRKIFRTLHVRAPGNEPVIGRMPAAAESEIRARLRKLIAVEHDAFQAAIARHAAVELVLAALAEFPEIGER